MEDQQELVEKKPEDSPKLKQASKSSSKKVVEITQEAKDAFESFIRNKCEEAKDGIYRAKSSKIKGQTQFTALSIAQINAIRSALVDEKKIYAKQDGAEWLYRTTEFLDPKIITTIENITKAIEQATLNEVKKLTDENASLRKQLDEYKTPTATITLNDGTVLNAFSIKKNA
jgi:hypothetical protein